MHHKEESDQIGTLHMYEHCLGTRPICGLSPVVDCFFGPVWFLTLDIGALAQYLGSKVNYIIIAVHLVHMGALALDWYIVLAFPDCTHMLFLYVLDILWHWPLIDAIFQHFPSARNLMRQACLDICPLCCIQFS